MKELSNAEAMTLQDLQEKVTDFYGDDKFNSYSSVDFLREVVNILDYRKENLNEKKTLAELFDYAIQIITQEHLHDVKETVVTEGDWKICRLRNEEYQIIFQDKVIKHCRTFNNAVESLHSLKDCNSYYEVLKRVCPLVSGRS